MGNHLPSEKYFGRGRVIIQSIPLRLQWSDLVKSQSFVVMLQDWLEYITQPRATQYNLQPGDPLMLKLADSEVRDAILRTPQGDEIELSAEPIGGGGLVSVRSNRSAR